VQTAPASWGGSHVEFAPRGSVEILGRRPQQLPVRRRRIRALKLLPFVYFHPCLSVAVRGTPSPSARLEDRQISYSESNCDAVYAWSIAQSVRTSSGNSATRAGSGDSDLRASHRDFAFLAKPCHADPVQQHDQHPRAPKTLGGVPVASAPAAI